MSDLESSIYGTNTFDPRTFGFDPNLFDTSLWPKSIFEGGPTISTSSSTVSNTNPDGSVTTTTETTEPDGKVTSTTKTTEPDGKVTSTTSTVYLEEELPETSTSSTKNGDTSRNNDLSQMDLSQNNIDDIEDYRTSL